MGDGKVAKNTAYLMTAFVGQKLLAFVYYLIVARLAGVEGLGKFTIAVAFTSMFSVMMDLGLGNVLVREVARRHDDAQGFLSDVLGAKLALSVFFAVLVTCAASAMGYSPEMRLMIGVASLAMILESVQVALYSVVRGFQNLRPEAIGVVIGQVVVLVAGTVLFIMWRRPVALVTALAINTAWNVIWGGSVLVFRYRLSLWPRLRLADARRLALLAAPFALAAVFSRVYAYVDQVMLSRYVTTAESGLYAAANKLAFAFAFLPSSFAAALYPAMSEYWQKDRAHLAEVLAGALKYLMLVVVPISFGLSALAAPILATVYSADFVPAAAVLKVLAFSLAFSFLYWPLGALLNACDHQSHNTAAMGTTMACSVAMNFFLLRHYGAMAAASVSLASNVLLVTMAFALASRVVHMPWPRILRFTASILLSGLVMWLVATKVFASAGFIPALTAGVISYPLMIVATKAVSRDEAKGLISLFLRRRRAPVAPTAAAL